MSHYTYNVAFSCKCLIFRRFEFYVFPSDMIW